MPLGQVPTGSLIVEDIVTHNGIVLLKERSIETGHLIEVLIKIKN